jgi:hypothetical protein
MPASAASLSRWRSDAPRVGPCTPRRTPLLAIGLGLAIGCGGTGGEGERAAIDPRALAGDPAVIADVAAREGLDEASAAARTRELAALAERYLARARLSSPPTAAPVIAAGEAPPGIVAAREAHLLRTVRARLWLTEVFEPAHEAVDMPSSVVERADALTMPAHGTIHVVCNLVVGPPPPSDAGPEDGPVLAKEDPAWRERARRRADEVAARLRRLVPDPSTEADCEFFQRTIRLGLDGGADPDLTLRVEPGGFESCREGLWDPGWVEAICPVEAPTWVDPFWTRFGVHVVAVIKVVEADPYDASARDARVREQALVPWRTSALGEALARMRRDLGVRVVAPPADAP